MREECREWEKEGGGKIGKEFLKEGRHLNAKNSRKGIKLEHERQGEEKEEREG